jgi:hypothetical protein
VKKKKMKLSELNYQGKKQIKITNYESCSTGILNNVSKDVGLYIIVSLFIQGENRTTKQMRCGTEPSTGYNIRQLEHKGIEECRMLSSKWRN